MMKLQDKALTNAVAANIRAARAHKGISQTELANAINANITTISSYERGKSLPGTYAICLLAKALDVSPNELIGWM